MLCPYQAEVEVLYLYRFFPNEFEYWEERERAKLTKFTHASRNLGVKGKLTLRAYLNEAIRKYGHWTDEQLEVYRFSHGHCVLSKY